MPIRKRAALGFFARCKQTLEPKQSPTKTEGKSEIPKSLRSSGVEPLEGRIAPAAVLSATKVDVFASGGDLNLDGNFDPGDTILYTVTITNSGDVDLTGVTFQDLVDSNTTLLGATVNASPLAFDESYSVVGNTLLHVGSVAGAPGGPVATTSGSVLDNDVDFFGDSSRTIVSIDDDALTGTAGVLLVDHDANGGTPNRATLTTAGGGSVTLEQDGHFTYLPAAGFTGSDFFTYRLQDSGGLFGEGRVNFTVTNKVWYVDDSAAAGGDGRSTTPFDSLADVTGASGPDAAGEIIFLSAGNYTGGITLLTNQTLWGENEALIVGGFTLNSAGTDPIISNAAGSGITLAQGNTVKGLTVGNTTASDIINTAATSVGSLTISNVVLNGTGALMTIANGGALTVSLESASTTSSATSALSLAGGVSGTFGVTGATSIAGVTGSGVSVNGSSVNVTFASLGVTTTSVDGVLLTNHTGSFTTTGGAFATITGTDFHVSGGTGTITFASNITNTAGRSVDIDNHDSGNISMTGTISDTGTGLIVQNSNGGTITFSNATNTFNTGANSAVTLSSNTGATINFTGGGLDIDTTSGSGFTATGGGTISVTGNTNTIASGTGTALNVTGTTISASGMTFLSIAANGAASGIILNGTGNTGFLTVTGNGTLSAGSAGLEKAGLLARNGSGGIIQNTTGDAVVLTNAFNVTLKQMNITSPARDGVQSTGGGNIVLSGVALTSPGAANPASDGSTGNPAGFGGGNGWIALNITGANSFDNNSRVFNWQSSQSNGVVVFQTATNFTSFTIDDAFFSTSATGADGFLFDTESGSTSGTVTVRDSDFTLIDQDAVQINNDGSGAIRAIVQGNNFHDADATGGDGNNTVFLALAGGGDLNFTIENNAFTNLARLSALAGVVQVNAAGGAAGSSAGAQLNGTIQNNTLTNPGFLSMRRGIMIAVEASAGDHGAHTVSIANNSVQGFNGIGIYASAVSVGGSDVLNSSFSILNNQVGTIAPVGQGGGDSGSAIEFETNVDADNMGAQISANVLIQGNTAVSNNTSGIGDTLDITNRSGNSTGAGNSVTINLTILGNHFTQSNAAGDVFQISNSVMTTTVVNVDLNSDNVVANRNTFTGGDADGVLLRNDAGTLRIENLSGGAKAFVEARNNGTFTVTGVAPVATGAVTMPTAPGFLIFEAPTVNGEITQGTVDQPPVVIVEAPSVITPLEIPSLEDAVVDSSSDIFNDGILAQTELDILVDAAIARWTATGLSAGQLELLESVTFSIADLPGWYLGAAIGTNITLDTNAAGNLWFVDATPMDDAEFANGRATINGGAAGRVDALTTITHELGHVLGLHDTYSAADRDTLMYGFIGLNERRLASEGLAFGVQADDEEHAGVEFINTTLNIGSLPVGKDVTVVFQATINAGILANSVSNQGTIDSDQTAAGQTDDPSVGGAADATVTPVDLPDVTVAVAPGSVAEAGGNLVYTFTREVAPASDLTINFSVGGTAVFSTLDYTQTGALTFSDTVGTVVMPAGQTTVTVTLDPTNDSIVEADETAILTVTSSAGYDVGTPAGATGTIDNDDSATITLSGGISQSEGNAGTTSYVFTATLSNPVQSGFQVAYTTSNGTATMADSDYTDNDGTLTFAGTAGETQTITVLVNGDNKVELNETFTVALGSFSSSTATQLAALSAAGSPQTATITNDDAATVSIAANVSNFESTTPFAYSITLSNPVDVAVTVQFSTTDGTATTADSDYTGITNQVVTFAAGTTTAQAVNVTVASDSKVEANEVFNVGLATLGASSRNVSLGTSAGTGTITNDDTATLTLSGGIAVNEGQSGTTLVTYTATLTNPVEGGFQVAYSTNDGTATTADSDYVDNDGTLTFAGTVGETQTISILVNGDTSLESDETYTVALGAISSSTATQIAAISTLGSPQTGTILTEDANISVAVSPASVVEDLTTNLVYTFTRTGFMGVMTVSFNIGGSALFTADYTQSGAATFDGSTGTVTFGVGASTATVTLDPEADGTGESNENISITLTAGTYNIVAPVAATGTIQDDDTQVTVSVAPASVAEDGNTNLVYTFTRVGPLGSPLTIDFTVGGGAAFGTDYTQSGAASFGAASGTATFLAGESTVLVTLDPTLDLAVEGDETAVLTVVSGSGYVAGGAGTNIGAGTINNDDTEVTVAVAPASVNEDGGSNLVYTFTRTGVTTGALTINFNVGGAAEFGTDYTQTGAASFTTTTGTATFLAGQTTVTVTLDPTADNVVEGSETAVLTVAAGSGYNVAAPTAATGTINNDDAEVTVAASPLAVDEDGAATIEYTFTRTGDISGALTVDFTVGGSATFGTDYSQSGAQTFLANSGTITFNPGVATALITVDPAADVFGEADETVALTVIAGSGYGTGNPSAATATITNDDTAVSVAVAPGSITENGSGTLVYTFTRSGDVSTNLVVNFGISGNATLTADYLHMGGADSFNGTTGTLTILTGSSTGTVTLQSVNDTLIEGDESVILTVAAGANYSAIVTPAAGTIADNDTAVISLGSTTSSNAEAFAGTFNIAVNLVTTADGVANTGTLAQAVSVNVEDLLTGTASNGADYIFSSPLTLTFMAGSGSGSQNAAFTFSNDTVVEGDETVNLALNTLVDPTSGQVTLGSALTHAMTITDNDNATVTLVSSSTSVTEGSPSALISVQLVITANGVANTGSLAYAVTVDVDDLLSGTATSEIDYTLSSTSVAFAAGATSSTQDITLNVVDDRRVEGSESANLLLNNLVESTGRVSIVGTTAHAVTITDNDSATVSLATGAVSVSEAASSQNVGVTLAITASGTGPVDIERAVSVDLVNSGTGTATIGISNDYTYTSPTTVTFAAGAVAGTQNVSLTLNDDRRVEGDETVNLELNTLVDGTTTQISLGAITSEVVTITDNDSATLTLAAGAVSVSEAAGSQNVEVALAISATGTGTIDLERAISANVAVTGGTATSGAGNDYTYASPTTVTFAAGAVAGTQNVSISLNDDRRVEGDETLNLALNTLVDGTTTQASLGAITSEVVTITDNDTATISLVSAASSVSEAAGSHNVGVALAITAIGTGTTDLERAVSVNLEDLLTGSATSAGTDYTYTSPTTVTFAAGAVAATQQVSLTLINDSASESNETVNLELNTLVDGTGTQVSLGTSAYELTILDNDVDLSIVVNQSTATPVAGSGDLTYTIVVTNVGLTSATGVTINEDLTLLSGVTFVSATPTVGSATVTTAPDLVWTLGNLAVGGSETLTVIVNVGSSAPEGTITNLVTISAANENLVNPANDTSTATANVGRDTELQISVEDGISSAAPGGTVNYTLTPSNAGPSDATGVVLTETLPAGTTFNGAGSTVGWVDAGGGVYTYSISTLASGAAGTSVIFSVSINNPAAAGQESVLNDVSIADDGSAGADPNPGNNTDSDTNTLNAAPDLVVSVSDSPTSVRPGDDVEYLISYSNVGNQDATGVVITMTLPENTSFNAGASSAGWVLSGGSYTNTVGALDADSATQMLTFAVTVAPLLPPGVVQISTTASIDDAQANGTDPVPANNSEMETTSIYRGIYVVSPGISTPRNFAPPKVRVFDVATGLETFSIMAYESNFRGSIRVAVGDVNGDGFDDIITTTATGTGRLRVFDGVTGQQFVEGPWAGEKAVFNGPKDRGAFVAAGDITGDGIVDIVVGSALGGGKVIAFDGATGGTFSNFTPFGTKFTGGVRVATGDVNGDGVAELIVGQGYRGAQVQVWGGQQVLESMYTFKVGTSAYRGGVSVAAGDVNGDGRADIIVGRNTGRPSQIEVFSGLDGTALSGRTPILPFDVNPAAPRYRFGVRVAAVDVNFDGVADIIAAAGGRAGSAVKFYDGVTHAEILSRSFIAYPTFPNSSLFVAASASQTIMV